MTLETDIPARLDRLPWGRFHTIVVIALGITWILDGLEVTIVGAIGAVIENEDTLDLSIREVGLVGSAYLAGAVLGALLFGYLTDRFGRRRLFMITLTIYAGSAVATVFAWDFWSFAVLRFLTGTAIGGEYSAVNSAIDELIPARLRGRIDLAISGSYWLGAVVGAAASLILLDPGVIAEWLGWRLCLSIGAVLSVLILVTRRGVPESPRWLITHGRLAEAERIVDDIEVQVAGPGGVAELPPPQGRIRIEPRAKVDFGELLRTLFLVYPDRAFLGLSLMVAQAFFYNAIFFTYAIVLTEFYDVTPQDVGNYVLPFAASNFLGPIALGPLFDIVGRRQMISATYAISGVLLAATGWAFVQGGLTATTQTVAWSLIFFFASAAASSAYLTVSEIFPVETRAVAISIYFAVGTAIGGVFAPALFGVLIQTHERMDLFYGYLLGAGLMLAAAVVELRLGIAAEGRSLEDIASPLTATSVEASP